MPIRTLALVSMPPIGNGLSAAVTNFRARFQGILSHRALNALSRLGPSGELKLQQLGKLLDKCAAFEPGQAVKMDDFNFGIGNRRLKAIISLVKTLDPNNQVLLEPAVIDGKFTLITTQDRAEYEACAGDPHSPSKIQISEHDLGILSYEIIKIPGNGYRTLAVVPDIEAVDPNRVLAKIDESSSVLQPGQIDPKMVEGTVFSEAKTIKDLIGTYSQKLSVYEKATSKLDNLKITLMFGGTLASNGATLVGTIYAKTILPFIHTLPQMLLFLFIGVILVPIIIGKGISLCARPWQNKLNKDFEPTKRLAGNILSRLTTAQIVGELASLDKQKVNAVLDLFSGRDQKKAIKTAIKDLRRQTKQQLAQAQIEASATAVATAHPRIAVEDRQARVQIDEPATAAVEAQPEGEEAEAERRGRA
ncbi:MAG: hypothetical protein PHH60_01320 [Candidatus Margulisbacteria bacterium]|nr:hypothetical protein [Candidatus Margulisiibacteriota bacterium]